jgi:seryl-tRNA synthetase
MIEIQRIKERTAEVLAGIGKRNIDATKEIAQIIALDSDWREKKTQLQQLETEMNSISKQIGVLFSTGKQDEAKLLKAKTGELKESLQGLKQSEEQLEGQIKELLFTLPNVCTEDVPKGKDEASNQIIEEYGSSPSLENASIPHWDLAKEYALIDFELGVKVTGAGFPFYRGQGARLQRALVSFFLDEAVDAGYEEFVSPLMVNESSGKGTGQLPDKEGQMYYSS